jgi:glucan phosphoethanolaminetransferase (alkaline phosphatase superfamily)
MSVDDINIFRCTHDNFKNKWFALTFLLQFVSVCVSMYLLLKLTSRNKANAICFITISYTVGSNAHCYKKCVRGMDNFKKGKRLLTQGSVSLFFEECIVYCEI